VSENETPSEPDLKKGKREKPTKTGKHPVLCDGVLERVDNPGVIENVWESGVLSKDYY
jgi:hypothetical protein